MTWTQVHYDSAVDWEANGSCAQFVGPAAGPALANTRCYRDEPMASDDQKVTAVVATSVQPAEGGSNKGDGLDLVARADSDSAPSTGYIGRYSQKDAAGGTEYYLQLLELGVGLNASQISGLTGELTKMEFTVDGASQELVVTGDGGPGDTDSISDTDASVASGKYAGFGAYLNDHHDADTGLYEIDSVSGEVV